VVYLSSLFFAGVFLANGLPHFINGISGKKFPTPFTLPRGVEESSPLVNVIWGGINFAIGYLLIFGVGDFIFGLTLSVLMVALGAIITAIILALILERIRRH